MRALESIASFRPKRLLEAVEEIRQIHTDRDSSTRSIPADLLNQVRRKLQNAPHEHLKKLAESLLPKELKAALQLLCMNEEEVILDNATTVLRFRMRKDLVKPGWRFLLANYPVDRLENLVHFFLSQFGCSCIHGDKYGERLQKWLKASKLVSGLLTDFEECPSKDVEAWFGEALIPEWAQLRAALWKEILSNASRSLINFLGHEVLLGRARKERISLQQSFAANYLIQLGGREAWNFLVLRWIRERFGTPGKDESQIAFWRRIPEEVRREFRRWVNETTIQQFFDRINDPVGRFIFWKEFIDEIEDASVVLGNQAMLMDFGRFGVVEFSQVGNAAYIYSPITFGRIRLLANTRTVSDLKDPVTKQARIIHVGNWQEKARPVIRRFLGRSRTW